MIKRVIYFILLLSFSLHAEYVDIQADHFYANDINKLAYFEGNAYVKQNRNEFNASKIVVYFNNKKEAEKYEARGNVSFDLTESNIHYKGHAKKVLYEPRKSKYYFSGNVLLKDLTNNRTIKAQTVSLDLKTGLADIKGEKKKPVHFRFQIEDRK